MTSLRVQPNALGFEIHDSERWVALYRVREEIAREESPKPCFAPIYTPAGDLVTEYRPKDHLWHTGLYFGWVHVNDANLWGGPWYVPASGRYEHVEHTHGMQRHEAFVRLDGEGGTVTAEEKLTWLDADDRPLAEESRGWQIEQGAGPACYRWTVHTRIRPASPEKALTLGASRAARYSGFELRLGPPFAPGNHHCSEGRRGHEAIMGQHARWVAVEGRRGGAVVMMDHPRNPRYPVTWFTRANLLGAGLLMEGDMEIAADEFLELRYALYVYADPPSPAQIEQHYEAFIG